MVCNFSFYFNKLRLDDIEFNIIEVIIIGTPGLSRLSMKKLKISVTESALDGI
jgi:hypothetical protein